MTDQWFSTQVRILCLIEGEGAVSQGESVHVFRAQDWESAFVRALELGRGHEQEYANGDGDLVRWRLDRVVTLDMLRVEDLDGVEVYSSLSDVSGGPAFDSEFHPEDHPAVQSGV